MVKPIMEQRYYYNSTAHFSEARDRLTGRTVLARNEAEGVTDKGIRSLVRALNTEWRYYTEAERQQEIDSYWEKDELGRYVPRSGLAAS